MSLPASASETQAAAQPQPIAVVELFTSEGCHSCPAADQFARELSAEARANGENIFVMGFHVDYWDRLGWADRFADAAFTARQHNYARRFQESRVYTPQAVINGTEHLVGSNRTRVRSAIDRALAQPASVSVEVELAKLTESHEAMVQVTLGSADANARLHVAVVERGLSTQVPRGENKGKLLMHADVVRGFVTVGAKLGGASAVAVPYAADVVPSEASIVAWVQDPKTGAVLGAGSADLASSVGR